MGVEVTFIGAMGADVIVWGGAHDVETPKGKKVKVLTLTDQSSAPTVINEDYAKQYEFDVVVGFMDCFGLEFLNEVKLPVIGYIPIDGPFTGSMKNYVRGFHKVIAYSKFGFNELQKFFSPSKIGLIYHGIDTETFHPLNEEEYKEARAWMARNTDEKGKDIRVFAPPIPVGARFIGIELAANIGPRKCLPLLMRTWAKFVKNHLDDPPHLILQTNSYAPGKGYDLVAHRSNLGMDEFIHFPVHDPIIHAVPDGDMRKIYGASTVFVHNAVAEGFGLPPVEACSCGIPPIGPDNSAQTENIVGHGWLVESVDPEDYIEFPVYVPTLQEYKIPSQKSLLEKLEEAYSNPDLVKEYGRKSREFVVKNYAWNKIMPQWIELLKNVEEDLELFKKLGEGIKSPNVNA